MFEKKYQDIEIKMFRKKARIPLGISAFFRKSF